MLASARASCAPTVAAAPSRPNTRFTPRGLRVFTGTPEYCARESRSAELPSSPSRPSRPSSPPRSRRRRRPPETVPPSSPPPARPPPPAPPATRASRAPRRAPASRLNSAHGCGARAAAGDVDDGYALQTEHCAAKTKQHASEQREREADKCANVLRSWRSTPTVAADAEPAARRRALAAAARATTQRWTRWQRRASWHAL